MDELQKPFIDPDSHIHLSAHADGDLHDRRAAVQIPPYSKLDPHCNPRQTVSRVSVLSTARLRSLFLAAKIDLAPRRPGRRELQRPLRGAGNLPAADAAFARDSRWRERIRAGGFRRAALLRSLVHKILCTAIPDESTPYTRRMKFRGVASDRDQNTLRNGRIGPAHQACCSLGLRP